MAMRSSKANAEAKPPKANATDKKAKDKAKTPAPAAAVAAKAAPVKATVADENSTTTSVVAARYRERYQKSDVKTPAGRATMDSGDPVAIALRGKPPEVAVSAVSANGGTPNPSWERLNSGLKRMAAANVLRGMLRSNGSVVIDGQTITDKVPAAQTKAPTKKAA